jgi:SulP family sulfate permease
MEATMRSLRSAQFSFTLREFAGSLADLGTLLPLLVGLIVFNGLGVMPALVLLGAAYILTAIYYRLPVPVQPLKAASMVAIATGASVYQIRAAALWMAGIMLVLAVTRLADKLNNVFPRVLIHGLQFGLGWMMIRSGVKLVISFPDGLGAVVHGTHAAHSAAGFLPSRADFVTALALLVLPQIPLTIGNAVLATRDCALKYFGKAGERVTSNRLSATIGIGNLAAGLVGGMPMCHGAGGMTAHYAFGARTGGAGLMIGTIFLVLGATASHWAGALLPSVPAWVLGAMLAYAGVRHTMLAGESLRSLSNALIVLSMGAVSWLQGNLLLALGVGVAIRLLVRGAALLPRRKWAD